MKWTLLTEGGRWEEISGKRAKRRDWGEALWVGVKGQEPQAMHFQRMAVDCREACRSGRTGIGKNTTPAES